jgi:hypothetical protein
MRSALALSLSTTTVDEDSLPSLSGSDTTSEVDRRELDELLRDLRDHDRHDGPTFNSAI